MRFQNEGDTISLIMLIGKWKVLKADHEQIRMRTLFQRRPDESCQITNVTTKKMDSLRPHPSTHTYYCTWNPGRCD